MIATCIFFAPIIPLAIPIALVGSILFYWSFKYMLLRVHKAPEMLNRSMGTFFGNLLPYIILVQAASFFIFMNFIEAGFNGKSYTA